MLSFVLAVSAFAAMDRVHGRLRSSSLGGVLPFAILLLAEVSKPSHSEVYPVTAHRSPTHGKEINHNHRQDTRNVRKSPVPAVVYPYLLVGSTSSAGFACSAFFFSPGLRSKLKVVRYRKPREAHDAKNSVLRTFATSHAGPPSPPGRIGWPRYQGSASALFC